MQEECELSSDYGSRQNHLQNHPSPADRLLQIEIERCLCRGKKYQGQWQNPTIHSKHIRVHDIWKKNSISYQKLLAKGFWGVSMDW